MTTIGLELSDAGILAAGGDPPRLLPVDGDQRESPGYAFVDSRNIIVAASAKDCCRRHPNRSTNRFWDQLDTTPWRRGTGAAITRAEIAYRHLADIWEGIKPFGQAAMIAVPPFYSRRQMGLLLGMAKELGIPVGGVVSLPVAAHAAPHPGRRIFYLDIHLHRLTVTGLGQGDGLFQEETLDRQGVGFDSVFAAWLQAIADLFVRRTRFDPLHDARSEQALFDHLPMVVTGLCHQSEMAISLTSGAKTRRITVDRSLVLPQVRWVKDHLEAMAAEIESRSGRSRAPMTLVASHRLMQLPGMADCLAGNGDIEVVPLARGAAALGAAELGDHITAGKSGAGVTLRTSRAFIKSPLPSIAKPQVQPRAVEHPTHLLYRHRAYPIAHEPLTVGRAPEPGGRGIRIEGVANGVSRRHCTVGKRADGVVLEDLSRYGTFVDGRRVAGSAPLKAGQRIRLGEPGETLELIVVVGHAET